MVYSKDSTNSKNTFRVDEFDSKAINGFKKTELDIYPQNDCVTKTVSKNLNYALIYCQNSNSFKIVKFETAGTTVLSDLISNNIISAVDISTKKYQVSDSCLAFSIDQ